MFVCDAYNHKLNIPPESGEQNETPPFIKLYSALSTMLLIVISTLSFQNREITEARRGMTRNGKGKIMAKKKGENPEKGKRRRKA